MTSSLGVLAAAVLILSACGAIDDRVDPVPEVSPIGAPADATPPAAAETAPAAQTEATPLPKQRARRHVRRRAGRKSTRTS